MMKYNEALQKAGVLLALDGLHPPSMGARVSFAGGKPKVTDGPFAEAKEVLGGYWMIQVKSREEAIEWASRCPGSENEMIEVRQVQEFADFPADVQEAAAGFAEMQAAARTVVIAEARPAGLAPCRPEGGVIGGSDGHRYPSRDRGGLADRVGPAHRRPDADACATSAWPRSWRRTRSSRRSSSGRSRASRTIRAPG